MDRETGADPRPARRLDAPAGVPGCLGIEREAALLGAQRRSVETGALVKDRQQCQADAGVGGGVGERPGQRERIVRVGAAVGTVLQVVELADLRVAAAQQLDVELRRDRAQLLGRDAQRDRVHALAPRPEVVVLAAGIAALGEAGEGALERMAVRIDQAGQHRPRQPRRFGRRLEDAGGDLAPAAVAADAQQHVLGPAVAEPGARRPQAVGAHAGRHASIVSSSRRNSGATPAACDSSQRRGSASSAM